MRLRRPLALWKVPPWPARGGRADQSTRPIILLYHSVINSRTDPWGVRVSPRNFREQMAVLRAHAHPMRLADLDPALRSDTLLPRSVIVTFDDGYVDNLMHARPALERFGVPATVFVASGYVGQDREYWWEEIDRLLLEPGTLPRVLELTIGGTTHHWNLEDTAQYGAIQAWRNRHWFAWQAPPTARHRVFRAVWRALHDAPSVREREAAIARLREMAGVAANGRPRRRCCDARQLRELGRGGLVEIGAHTIDHPSLAFISPDDQRREIAGSKAAIEHILDQPVQSFAYPFGSREDYTATTVEIVREAGFRQACSNFPEPLVRDVHRLQYPRRVVMDWDGVEFAARLADWFADAGASPVGAASGGAAGAKSA